MKAVIQRVHRASVSSSGEIINSIGKGLCVLVGIHKNDQPADSEYIARKIANIRLFANDSGKKWNLSVKDLGYEILCISQFTLYCELKGNKPDYRHNMGGDVAQEFYADFLKCLGKHYNPEMIKDGKFGAMMDIELVNDGPVTITLDSRKDVLSDEKEE